MILTMRRLALALALPVALALLAGLPMGAQAHDGAPDPIAATEGGSRVYAVSAGYTYSCALKANGAVACWGLAPFLGTEAQRAGPFVSVSAGSATHTCGLKADGTVGCWGGNGNGQSSPPAGQFLSVSAGEYHSCGLRTDGSVACWGNSANGRLGTEAERAGPFVSVSAGQYQTCAVRTNGNAFCWGAIGEDDGQATAPAGTFLSVSAAYNHSCGLKSDGSIACWGRNTFGQSTVPAGSYLSVAAGGFHSCGLKSDGSIACWGGNFDGQLGTEEQRAGPYQSVSAGFVSTCGLRADGSAVCWGYNDDGQTTVPETLGMLGFGQIAAGNAHACELKRDGTIACWGNNDQGQATAPAGMFTQVVAGDGHSCAIRVDGTATCWGRPSSTFINTVFDEYGPYRQLASGTQHAICALATGAGQGQQSVCVNEGVGDHSDSISARNITSDYSSSLSQFASSSLCAVAADGTGYCRTVSGAVSPADGAIPQGLWQRLESGLNHQCGLKANGSIECWGDNLVDNQLDNLPASTETFRAFSVGWNHACAIRDNGQLDCWGSNLNGQADAPAGEYIQVAAGNTFTCAIRSDGERVCWGASPGNPASLSGLPDGDVGQPYSTQIAISGPSAPTGPVFVVMSGTLPPGLTLSSAGLLAGTPTTLGTYTFTIDAEGTGGFAASRSYSVAIAGDATPPVINYTLTAGLPGNNGWYTGNVTITWSVVDTESPAVVDAGCGIGFVDTLASDTAGATFSCTATSGGGTSSKTTTTIKRDATPPTISAAATTAPNANGWYSGDVTIHFTCSDVTSGLAGACPADVVLTASGSSATPTIFDNAGNSATSNAVTVQIDKSAPVVGYVFAPPAPDGNNGWYRGNVGIDWTIGDAQSGIASSNGCADSTLSSDTSGANWTCTATNNAGLQTSVTTGTIKRDATAPTLSPTVPSPILRGQSYSASPNAVDALSGLASQSCAALDTTTTGNKSTSCSATDNAGNSNTVTLNYTVTTTCANDGFKGTQLTWCRNICENGLTGATLDSWIHRWVNRYRDLPYCLVAPQPQLQ